MPTFDYHARNKEGKKIHGQRLAQSKALLAAQLIREGVSPVTITQQNQRPDVLQRLINRLPGNVVTTDDVGIFARQMHALLKTGVPVSAALRQLAENARNRQFSLILNSVVSSVESGHSLSSSMQDYPNIFSPVMVSMVQVGEAGGHLDESFLHLNHYLELESIAIKRAKAALRYPIFVLLAMFIAFIVVTGWVIPTFARVFKEAHLTLPLLTRVMLALADSMARYGLVIAIVFIFFICILIYYLRTPLGRYQWGWCILQIPVIGVLQRRIILLRFAQTFSVVSAAGVPLLDGIVLCAQTTENAWARSEILSLKKSIENGLNLTSAIAANELFTSLEVQMLGVSEQTGQLTAMFTEIAAFYQREVAYDLKRLSDILEPIIMGALALLAAILAFSVYLPIWNMVNLVHS